MRAEPSGVQGPDLLGPRLGLCPNGTQTYLQPNDASLHTLYPASLGEGTKAVGHVGKLDVQVLGEVAGEPSSRPTATGYRGQGLGLGRFLIVFWAGVVVSG